MHKTILISLFTSFILCCQTGLHAQRLKGSDTLLPLAQSLSEQFRQAHPQAQIAITGGGSGVGLAALREGTADIAMASRRMKFGEKMKFAQAGRTIEEVVVARDALAVVVHPGNPVKRLTREQLEGIFRGKITNWNQVGGPDRRIVVYTRETSSGTYEFFKESILHNKNYMAATLSLPATGAVIQSVSQTPGAIGYIGLAYLSPRTKALEISFDGKPYAAPNMESARNGSYPVVRPLYFYYDAKQQAAVWPLIGYMVSPGGQALAEKNGFVPVK